MSKINDNWWLEKGLELVELEDRAMLVHKILGTKDSPNIKKNFSLYNLYNGRYQISSLMECLDSIMKSMTKKSIMCNININYIFLTPRLSPYYFTKEYQNFSFNKNENIYESRKLTNEEKTFIKGFIEDFTKYINEIIKSSVLERSSYYMNNKTYRKLEIFKEKLCLMELRLYNI